MAQRNTFRLYTNTTTFSGTNLLLVFKWDLLTKTKTYTYPLLCFHMYLFVYHNHLNSNGASLDKEH